MNDNTQNVYSIRLPNISAATAPEQLMQIRSYLYQMAQQLQFALGSVTARQEQIAQTSAQAAAAAGQQSPAGTFNAIKSLIIKSAEIVDAYYEEVSRRLESKFVAQSQFGSFAEEMNQTVTESAAGIERIFENIQSVESDLAQLRDQTLAVSAYVNTGLLSYDTEGFPVYGLEIGQRSTRDGVTTFHKYARFTADKLSFYDNNDVEVAYFSDYKMYITNVHITGMLTHGGYAIDPAKGLKYKWKGGA